MSKEGKGKSSNKLLDILSWYSKLVAMIASLFAFFTRQIKLPVTLTYLIVAGTYIWIAWVLVSAIRSEDARAKLPIPWLKSRRSVVVLLACLSILSLSWFGYYGWSDYQAWRSPIPPQAEGEILIIISEFTNPSTPESQYIFQEISKPIAELKKDGVRIGELHGSEIIHDEERARLWLQETGATMVIWGWHIANILEPHISISPLTEEDELSGALEFELSSFPFELNAQMAESYEFLSDFAIARVMYYKNDNEKAIQYLDQALRPDLLESIRNVVDTENWGVKYAYYIRAIVYTTLEKYGEAIRDYKKALEQDDEFAAAYNNLGNLYAKQPGEIFTKFAIENYTKAVDLGLPIASFNLGNLYVEKGDYCLAMNHYKQAVTKWESSLVFLAYYNRGALQAKLRNFGLAREDFDRALSNVPEDRSDLKFDIYNARAKANLAMCNYKEAAEDLTYAISLWDEGRAGQYLIGAYTNRGEAYVRQGRYDQAIGDLRKALDIKGDHSLAYYNLACALSLSGDVEGAIQALIQAIQLDPSNAEYAACDPDFDPIRLRAGFPAAVQPPAGGCSEKACADPGEEKDPCMP